MDIWRWLRTIIVLVACSLAALVDIQPPPTVPSTSTTTTIVISRCDAASAAVEEAGIYTPPEFEFRCPAAALDEDGQSHWGITCWHFLGKCENSPFYIEINVAKIGSSNARLRYVIAHERCHALEIVATGTTSEASADACAASAGFPRV